MKAPIRQGDVLIIPIKRSTLNDLDLIEVERDAKNRVVLADGEVTGHAHAILDDAATLFRHADLDEMDDRFLRVDETVSLVHEEHATIELPAGDYIVRRKREYTPERAVYVYD